MTTRSAALELRGAAVSRDPASTRRTRPTAAGLCYLTVIAGGLFAEVVVRQARIVPGDATATARAIWLLVKGIRSAGS